MLIEGGRARQVRWLAAERIARFRALLREQGRHARDARTRARHENTSGEASTMREPRRIDELDTPAAIVDVDRMTANLDRMAEYARRHGLALRPHIKTHKTPELASEQLRRGAAGLTVATVREAEVMAAVCEDLLLAYPPVGARRLERLLALPRHVHITVALDSLDAIDALAHAARLAEREVVVRVEADVGMGRVGVAQSEDLIALARAVRERPPLAFGGLQFYAGHIRQRVSEQEDSLMRLSADVAALIADLEAAGFAPPVVSGGSTPAAFTAHRVKGMGETRPGTYIFNDRTTAAIDACAWDDCAYTVLATVVSNAVPGQAVVDAGSKALFREDVRGNSMPGFGALLDRPEVIVKAMSEEHGMLDLAKTDWRPRVGEQVRIVPNHVCVSVNLHPVLWGVRGDAIETRWTVAARGWTS
jgi:D-serine deaminase-like pyridoxal phosphate-dependent protein